MADSTGTPTTTAYRAAGNLALRMHLRRGWQLATRHWGILLAMLAAGLAIAAARAFTSPDLYRAWSVLRIAPRVQTGFTPQAQYQEVLDKYYENQLYDMQSAAVLERVHARFQERFPGAAPPSYRALRGQGAFFQMVVDANDFDHARLFAEVWAQEFVNFKSRLKSDAFDRTARATREEVIRHEEKLDRIRNGILDFKKRHDVANIRENLNAAQDLLNQLVAEQTKFSTLRQLLENTTKEAIASGALIDSQVAAPEKTATERASAPRPAGTDPVAKFNTAGSRYRELTAQLRSREAERERWSTILRPKHDFMAALDRDIVRLRRDLEIELALIEESRLALLASYRQNEKSYEPLIRKQNEIVLSSSGVQHEFNKLTEEETMVGKQLGDLRRTLAELDLTLSSNEEDLTISEKGAGSRTPVAPNRPRILLTGLLVGLLSGVGLAYLLHRLDDRLDLAEDIEDALGEPVLGQVPLVKLDRTGHVRLFAPDLEPHDMFVESMRSVRSSVLFSASTRPAQILVVTSAVPGDGKTTFTTNFAATLATMNQRVLLVDVDLRRGTIHDLLRLPRGPGLSEILTDGTPWRDTVRATEVPNLSVITSGALPAHPAELLLQPATRALLDAVRQHYDAIILDTPPLVGINDTSALIPACDGVLFVVRAGQTSMKLARTALEALRRHSSPVLGLVLNGITPENPYYYYQQYYHAYYNRDAAGRSPTARVPSNSILAEARGLNRRSGGSAPPVAGPDAARIEAFKRRHNQQEPSGDAAGSGPTATG